MNLRGSLNLAGRAARANLRPGAVLWAALALFLTAYLLSDSVRGALLALAEFKTRAGYPFAFASYTLSAAVLPELLQAIFFQGGRVTARNARNALFGALVWGTSGVITDAFFRCQTLWFGAGHDWQTLALKVLADQFGYSFLANGWILAVYTWRAKNFRAAAWREIFTQNFFLEQYVPMIVAVLCVWLPGTALVYFMPSALQLPVASLITCFWVLIFTFLRGREPAVAA